MVSRQELGFRVITVAEALLRIFVAKGWGTPSGLTDPWQAIYERCESPIERLMCIGIQDLLGYEACAVPYMGGSSIPPGRRAGALVFGQQELGPYRVDFLILGFVSGEQSRPLIVECDGREFHDPLSDQERDYNLSLRGFETIRFTGHEISRDLDRQIRRIPIAMGERYSYLISAAYGRVYIPDVVDQLERKALAQITDDEFDDGFSDWSDTL
jgi:very-short-patch-repair endonuclease